MEIELTKDEQQLVDLLTDKLIEVAHNPKLREEFNVKYEPSDTIACVFNFDDDGSMSEIEHIILFYGAEVNNESDRMQLWIEQVQDEYIKREMYYYSMAVHEMDAGNYGKAADLFYKYILSTYCIDERYILCLAKSEQWETLASIAIQICRYGVYDLPLEKSNDYIMNYLYLVNDLNPIIVIHTVFNKIIDEWADHFEKPLLAYMCYGWAVFFSIRNKQKTEEYLDMANEVWQLNEIEKAKMYSYILERDKYDGAEAKEVILSYLDKYMPKVSSPYNEDIEVTVGRWSGYFDLPESPKPKKGSFDWLYNQAEKSYIAIMNNRGTEQDYTYLRQLSEAYRTGNGVRRNLRLADCWAEMVKGTEDSYFQRVLFSNLPSCE